MAKLNFMLPAVQQERTPLDIARRYIAAGVSVFPCRESASEGIDYATGEIIEFAEKAPFTTFGLKDATRSTRIIDIWFGERYPKSVIGIPTGEKLGAWVLDLDRHGDRDGHVWLAAMEAKHGPLPATARATTANGGTHIFFKHVEGVRNRAAIAPGVDTRGEGGYIVGPGSVMADGRRYQWLDHEEDGLPEFADAPEWLLDLVITKAPSPVETKKREYTYQPEASGSKERYVSKAFTMELDRLASSPKGQRGQQLFASACSVGELVATGLISRSEAESGLLDSAISNGLVATDGERKCVDKIKRGLDKTANSPREIPDSSYDNDNTPAPSAEVVSSFIENTKAKQLAKQQAAEPAPNTAPSTEPAEPKKRGRFEVTWFDEIEEGKPKETILKNWLGVGEFTTISGLPGTGKSVVTTDLACHIAAGMDWHGLPVKQGLVVYVAAERKKLTERRMMAFRKHHNVHNVPLLVVGGMLDFTRDEKDAEAIIGLIREAETITEQKCVWVIIDTLTRVFGAGDQNASKDMVRFVRSCDRILTDTGAHVTAIHHSAWSGERGKGAIDLDGAVDASFMVKKEGSRHKLVCDGTNDGEEGDVLAFTMQSVTIGHSEDGEPTTAPVVMVAGAEPKMSSGTLKGYRGDALKSLHDAIDKHGIEPEGDAFPEGVLVVDEQTWRAEFYNSRDTTTAGGAETARKQFQRAPRQLVESAHVNNIGLWYWPAAQPE